jgi:hypothetical protein
MTWAPTSKSRRGSQRPFRKTGPDRNPQSRRSNGGRAPAFTDSLLLHEEGVPLDEKSLVLSTRSSNALDFALLIQELVPLLEAYEHAWRGDDDRRGSNWQTPFCQGVSPDPELFVNRVELLGAYSMIEHLFITTDRDGRVVYTPMGRRHVRMLAEYEARIGRLSKALYDDCSHFRPIAGAYSPYGILYGFSSDLLEHMALKTLQPDAVTRFGLEDVFVDGDADTDKLAWVTGWRKLPHVPRGCRSCSTTPRRLPRASSIGSSRRCADACRMARRTLRGRTGRLFILPADTCRPIRGRR